MKPSLSTVLCCAFAFVAAPALCAADTAKPNIILIVADDMGFSDLGCFGSEIATPNLDRLAANGLRFTSFYNSAKCEPTRSSLMSGQYWQDCGLGIKKGITMGEAIRPAGYDTFALGKWHLLGNPVDRGFDHYFGHLGGASDYFKGSKTHYLDHERFTPGDKFYTTDANADYAVRFMEAAHKKQPDKPYFMYLAFNAPHAPIQAWPEDVAKYRGKYRVGWDVLREQRYQKQLSLGIMKPEWALSPRPETIPAWSTLTDQEKDFEDLRMATFAAMIDRMDQAIGRVLAKVKEQGEEQNTLVMFTSDNGASPYDHTNNRDPSTVGRGGSWEYGLGWACLSDTPYRHFKRNMMNGGSNPPFIASWPAMVKNPGTITDQRAHIIDLMATLIDCGGGTWPSEAKGEKLAPLPGKSLRPILLGEQRTPHDALYFQLFDHRAVIMGDWKLVAEWGHPWELYNLTTDRTELHDLFKTQPEEAAKLAKSWDTWASITNVKISSTPEPIYRHLADAKESFVGGVAGDEDDSENGDAPKTKKKNKEK